MKLTKSKLKQIIKEELKKTLKEFGEAPQDFYAYVEVPYEGGMIIEGDSVEEVKEEAANYGRATVIFTANIIEGAF